MTSFGRRDGFLPFPSASVQSNVTLARIWTLVVHSTPGSRHHSIYLSEEQAWQYTDIKQKVAMESHDYDVQKKHAT